MKRKLELPPPRVLHRTLSKITERLAHELSAPIAVAPDWSSLEWRLAPAVAAMHGVSPLLATQLRWQGPSQWQTFLHEQHAHVAARHARIQELLNRIDARARAAAVALVGLKGAALHALGLYLPGERPMADIDLLVRPSEAQRATEVLASLGFGELYANWKHRVFAPQVIEIHAAMGEHADNYLKIELHERIAEPLPLRRTDVTRAVFPSDPQPGLIAYPSRAALMIHLLLHAAGAMAYRALRLLHLQDIARVAGQMNTSDWQELLDSSQTTGKLWWALPPLQLTARYSPHTVPAQALAALSSHCLWTLRRICRDRTLSDVSLSYPWVEAFPGIGWSQSLAEIFQYIGSRVRPSKELFHLRQVAQETEVAASQTQWSRLSQKQRLLRWMTSTPIRIDTLHAVRTALSQSQ